MWIIVCCSLNSKNICVRERFYLSKSLFLCIGWKSQISFKLQWTTGGSYWFTEEWAQPASRLERQDSKQTCNNQTWISALVEAFTSSLKAKVYSVFVICSGSLASPQSFVVPLGLDRCWWFTFLLSTLCDEKNNIPPFCTEGCHLLRDTLNLNGWMTGMWWQQHPSCIYEHLLALTRTQSLPALVFPKSL